MDPLKAEYLRRLGIATFVPRGNPVDASGTGAPALPAEPIVPVTDAAPPASARLPPADSPARPPGEDRAETRPGSAGLPASVAARAGEAAPPPTVDLTTPTIEAPAPELPPPGDLAALEACVARCEACSLHRGRTRTVFGSGEAGARWMIVGEGPGAEEDRQGLPFVGRAGQLLTAMIESLGLTREAVYIANTVKCRPPGNRDPSAEEMAACRPYLERQIEGVQPALILAVGRIAAQSLLGSQEPLARLRGRLHHYPGTQLPLVVTYHPAYLLRSPREKRKAWEDLLYARAQVAP